MSAKSGLLSIVCVQLGPRKLSIIRTREVAAKQGFLKYSNTILNGNAVGTKVSVRHRLGGHESGVFVKRGSTVQLLYVRKYLQMCQILFCTAGISYNEEGVRSCVCHNAVIDDPSIHIGYHREGSCRVMAYS